MSRIMTYQSESGSEKEKKTKLGKRLGTIQLDF